MGEDDSQNWTNFEAYFNENGHLAGYLALTATQVCKVHFSSRIQG